MGKKVKKATKKFQKNQLGRVLKDRRARQRSSAKRDKIEKDKEQRAAIREHKAAEARRTAPKLKPRPQHGGMGDVADMDLNEFMTADWSDDGAFDSDDGMGNAMEGIDSNVKTQKDEEEEKKKRVAVSDEDEDDEDADHLDPEQHKRDLERLKETDPEFHAYLVKENKGMLAFSVDDDDDGAQDEPKESTKKNKKKKKSKKKDEDEVPSNVLTLKRMKQLQSNLETNHSIGALRRLLRAFRTVVRAGEGQNEDDPNAPIVPPGRPMRLLLGLSLHQVPEAFLHHLGARDEDDSDDSDDSDEDDEKRSAKESKAARHRGIKHHPRFMSFQPLLRSYLGNVLFYLTSTTDSQVKQAVLESLELCMPLFMPFKRLMMRLLKNCVQVWSSDADENTRILAFLRIRQLVLQAPAHSGCLETALKNVYLTYVRHSKFTTAQSLPFIQFMANCVVELYSIEQVSSYQHAFVYVRQLAIHLRNAITSKTKDSHASVYNWQYVNCLRVWAKVLSTLGADKNSELFPLVYPFVQICFGVLNLAPITRFFPLRFHVARFLNELAENVEHYIPVSTYLLSVFEAPELNKKPRGNTAKPPNMLYNLHVSKNVLNSAKYQQLVVDTALDLLEEHYRIYSYSIGFPELVLPAHVFLRKFAKDTRVHRFRKRVQQLLDRLDRNKSFVDEKRSQLQVAPHKLLEAGYSSVFTFRAKPGDNKTNAAFSPLDRFAGKHRHDGDDDDAEEEAEFGLVQQQQQQQQQQHQQDSDDEDEEEEEQQQQQQMGQKHTGKKRKSPSSDDSDSDDAAGDDGEYVDTGDQVQELKVDELFSDDDKEDQEEQQEEEQEQPRKKRRKNKKAKKAKKSKKKN